MLSSGFLGLSGALLFKEPLRGGVSSDVLASFKERDSHVYYA